ncbi:MAG TPA: hypothetical protein VGL83_08125 [Stellaceae bacterium]|jgi:hypothetical protein
MIRLAELGDVPAIADLACSSSSEALAPASHDAVCLFAHEVIRNQLGIVALREGKIIGAIGLRAQVWPQNGGRFLTDIATFGGEGVLAELIDGAREVARHKKLPLYLGAMSKDPAAVMRLYELHGGKLVGAFYDFTPL